MMTSRLTYVHLVFLAQARQPIRLRNYQAAEQLRDALADVMLRTVCPETQRRAKPRPEHAAVCPACWLLAAEADPGQVRRAYSLVGPIAPLDLLQTGDSFPFVITLFGEGERFLPYFILAASAMGDIGIGPGRGRFEVQAIWSENPFTGESIALLERGEKVVRPAVKKITWEDAERLAQAQPACGDLRIHFLSPTRLIAEEALIKAPDFGVFFRRLVERIDELSRQYNQGVRRSAEEITAIYRLADQVRLVHQDTRWIELWGPSSRRGQRTPMGGFIGSACYRSKHWEILLPWLLFGQGVQAGKLTAKGNGVFQIELPQQNGYWQAIMEKTK